MDETTDRASRAPDPRGWSGDTAAVSPSDESPGGDVSEDLADVLRGLAAVPELYPGALSGRELTPGDRLGRFEILRELGQGGFGAVYEAHDAELDRRVAIKVVRPRGRSPARLLARVGDLLAREAKAAARLKHVNIVTLYDVASWQGLSFLVLELVEGETLQRRLARGPLGIDEALAVCIEIAQGLAHAHRVGLIHRDLKPGNVLLGSDGSVKLADLGLARVIGAIEEIESAGAKPAALSQVSTLLGGAGTPAYMAPEQWRKEPQDQRTDVFSLGVILYEMCTGRHPFERTDGDSTRDPFPAEAPSLKHVLPAAPGSLARTLARALEREPARRFRDGAEMLEALRAVQRRRVAGPRRRWLLLATAALVVALGVAAARWLTSQRRPAARPADHRQLTFTGDARAPALSSDGRYLAFVSGERLMVAAVGGGPGRQVYRRKFLSRLRWSPAGAELLFRAGDTSRRESLTIRLADGVVRPAPTRSKHHAWAPDGSGFVYAEGESAHRLHFVARDGRPQRTIDLPSGYLWLDGLDWSRRTNRIAYLTEEREWFGLWVIGADGSGGRRLLRTRSEIRCPRWSAQGDALYYLERTGGSWSLRKLPLDGKPRSVLTGLQAGRSFSLSADGRRLVYLREPRWSNLTLLEARGSGFERGMTAKRLTRGTFHTHSPALSPDGRRVAYTVGERPSGQIYLRTVAGGPRRQLTALPGWSAGAAWSWDGQTIAFGSTARGEPQVWTIPATRGEPRSFAGTRLHNESVLSLAWTVDGRVAFQRPGSEEFHALDPRTGRVTPLLGEKGKGWIFSPRFSPDGRWIVMYRNQKRWRGLLVRSLGSGQEVPLRPGLWYPVGWCPDSTCLYAHPVGEYAILRVQRIERIDLRSHKTVAVLRLPDGEVYTQPTISADGSTVVVTTIERQPDVWLVENFDPEATR